MVEIASRLQRLLIVGSPAAGKSDLAQRIGLMASLPVHHLDALYYRPGWVDQNEERWRETVEKISSEERWVIDGNHLNVMPQRLARAQAIFWLDYDRIETTKRVLSRMILPQPMPRLDLAEGCVESWSVDFLTFAWNFVDTERKLLDVALAAVNETQVVIRVQRPKDLRYFMDRFKNRFKSKA